MNMFCKDCGKKMESEKELCEVCEKKVLENKKTEHKKKWGWGKWSFLITFIVAFVIVRFIVSAVFTEIQTQEEIKKGVKTIDFMQEVAEEINRDIGISTMIDKYTRFNGAMGTKGMLTYRYTITNYDSNTKNEVDLDAFFELLEEQITHSLCSEDDMEVFIENDVTFRYLYFGYDEKLLGSFSVDLSEKCN